MSFAFIWFFAQVDFLSFSVRPDAGYNPFAKIKSRLFLEKRRDCMYMCLLFLAGGGLGLVLGLGWRYVFKRVSSRCSKSPPVFSPRGADPGEGGFEQILRYR